MLDTLAGWKLLKMTNRDAFKNAVSYQGILRKVGTSVIRTILLIQYHSLGALDKEQAYKQLETCGYSYLRKMPGYLVIKHVPN